MATGFSTYVDSGSYISEVVTPSGINIPALPFAVCLIGTASRNKRIVNEVVTRGQVTGETITPLTSSPHSAVLANRAVKQIGLTQVQRVLNGITTNILQNYTSFNQAFVLGTTAGPFDLSNATATNCFGLTMDGNASVTMALHPTKAYGAGAPGVVVTVISGQQVTIARSDGTFIVDGLRPGHTVTLTLGDAANNLTYTVNSVTATSITATATSGTPATHVANNSAVLTFNAGVGFVGREIHVLSAMSGTAGNAALLTETVTAINAGLAAATSLGFGSAYTNAADSAAGFLRITSPATVPTATSDVVVSAPFSHSGLTILFGSPVAGNRSAQTYLVIADAVWNSSATWKINYVSTTGLTDALANINVQGIVSVGSSKGGTNWRTHSDQTLTGNTVDWSVNTGAVTTGTVAPTYNLSTNVNTVLGFDGLVSSTGGGVLSTDVLVTLAGASVANPPIGYVDPVSDAAATAAEVSNNINAYVAAALGPTYDAVASVVVINGLNYVKLTSPTVGQAVSSIYVSAAATLSATTAVFGGPISTVMGQGKRPAPGTAFYVTYDFTRPSTDYEVPFRSFSVDAAIAQVGAPSASTAAYNPLGIGAQIAFACGAQFIYTVQINDTAIGNPTRQQVDNCLNGAGVIPDTTEIVVLDAPGTQLTITTDMINHLETQNSSIEQHPRRIFCGMAAGTPVGDANTVNSYIGEATGTLQVSPTSPGRGRMFLVVPPQQSGITKDVTLDDGTVARLTLDSTYLACAVAAMRTALSGPAETLTGKNLQGGFNTSDITQAWLPAQRRLMAGQGCFVITFEKGSLRMKDAMSTEGGGGGQVKFQVDSTSYQKDIITTQVNQALDANIVGIVPFDLTSFLLDIKLVIQGVLATQISKGTIGPFRDSSGQSRPIDLRTDIQVLQDVNTPTSYNFSYAFFLRYPALRLFGQYTVDAPALSIGS